jgi:hypothetical protein
MIIISTRFQMEIKLFGITLRHLSWKISTPTCKTHRQTLKFQTLSLVCGYQIQKLGMYLKSLKFLVLK